MTMKTTKIILLAMLISFGLNIIAQVAINNDGSEPDGSAILDLKSSAHGFLLPRLTSTQMQAINNPADGLQIYNTDSSKIYLFVSNDFKWKEVKFGDSELSPFADISIGSGGSCNNSMIMGTYEQGVYLTSSEYVTLEVNVTSQGAYFIATDTINSYSFSASGTFTTTGTVYVNLAGSGLPNSVQTDNFTVIGNGNEEGTCSFNVTVTSGGGPACGIPFTDSRDGKSYETVQIGTQCWMEENLNIGIRIDGVDEQTDNNFLEKYCFDDITTNCDTYGGLYQWAEVVQYLNGATNTTSWDPVPTGNIQGICPNGWHLPTDDEWKTMEMYLGMSQSQADALAWRGTDEGEKMKSTSGWDNNGNGTNSSGFNALPGGSRSSSGSFYNLGGRGYWWSSSEGSGTGAWSRKLYYSNDQVYRSNFSKTDGFSVRCLKD